MAKALPWRNRLQRSLSREATFLPKRLVLVALLLLVIYLGLLIRTEQKIRQTALGFVEANLQSKLVADYEQAAKPSAPLAPLRLEILRAKIQDENPTWSEAEVDGALQRALASAAAPILQATPTPYPTTRMIVQAAVVVNAQGVLDNPASVGHIRTVSEQQRPATATTIAPVVPPRWTAHSVAVGTPVSAIAFAGSGPSYLLQDEQPAVSIAASTITPGVVTLLVQAPVKIVQTTPTPLSGLHNMALPSGEMLSPPTIIPTPPFTVLSTANSTPTNLPVTHLAASHPGDGESTLPLPTLTASGLWAPPMTATPTATWTPSPTPTSTAPSIVPTKSQAALPDGATATATVTPLVLAPVFPTATPVSTVDPALWATPLPSPTATASPTSSSTPTLLPTIHGMTAQTAEDKVILAWEPAMGSVVGYHLYRGETMAGPLGERRNETPLVNATYVDTVVLDGRSYFYYVTVVDQQSRESLPSPVVVVPVADRTPPDTPNLQSLHLSSNQLQIRWQANTEADLAGYRLYRSTNWPVDRSQGPIHGVPLLTTPSYQDQVVLNGQTYYYVFTAVDQAGNESPPSIDAQMPTIDLTAPAAPTGLTATVQQRSIQLTWQANNESDLAGYRLYRSLTLPVDTSAPPIHSQPLLTAPFYTDGIGEEDKSYYYTVVAVDANQNGSLSSEAVLVTVK